MGIGTLVERILAALAVDLVKRIIYRLFTRAPKTLDADYFKSVVQEDLQKSTQKLGDVFPLVSNLLAFANTIDGRFNPRIQTNLMAVDSSNNTLRIVAASGFKPLEELQKNIYWANTNEACVVAGAKKAACSECFTTGQMMVVENTAKDNVHLTRHQRIYLASMICFPLRDRRGDIVGVINLDSYVKYMFLNRYYARYRDHLLAFTELLHKAQKPLAKLGVTL